MYILSNATGLGMGSYPQFGMRALAYAGPVGHRRGSALGRMLLTAAFVGAVCLIAIVIGVASAQ
jgi:hypothetical protein